MNYLWFYFAAVVGGIMGFGVCALLNASKDKEVFTVENIVKWLTCSLDSTVMDKTIDLIVRRVYDGTRSVHRKSGPRRKKPSDKYPTSEG